MFDGRRVVRNCIWYEWSSVMLTGMSCLVQLVYVWWRVSRVQSVSWLRCTQRIKNACEGCHRETGSINQEIWCILYQGAMHALGGFPKNTRFYGNWSPREEERGGGGWSSHSLTGKIHKILRVSGELSSDIRKDIRSVRKWQKHMKGNYTPARTVPSIEPEPEWGCLAPTIKVLFFWPPPPKYLWSF